MQADQTTAAAGGMLPACSRQRFGFPFGPCIIACTISLVPATVEDAVCGQSRVYGSCIMGSQFAGLLAHARAVRGWNMPLKTYTVK